jgi:L-threonylcarbamoyladenylate synthase
MKTRIISSTNRNAIEIALQTLLAGGVVGFPTDTVYGIAVPVGSHEGIERLYQIKERSAAKSIAVLIGCLLQVDMVTSDFKVIARLLARQFWPGALTIVVPRHPNLPDNLSSNPNVGIRIPNLPFARKLLKLSGPLATTSANISGHSTPVTASGVIDELDGRIELLIDGGFTPGNIASTVVDCTTEKLSILREGVIPAQEITKLLSKNT